VPNVILPEPTADRTVLGRCFEIVRRALSKCVSTDEAAPQIILRAPNGTSWRVTVSNTGTLTTTQV